MCHISLISQRRQSGLISLRSWILAKKMVFPGKFPNDLFLSHLHQNFHLSRQTNLPFTATFLQYGLPIVFLLKSHRFQKSFLYIIKYNNISRPPSQNLGVRDPQDWRLLCKILDCRNVANYKFQGGVRVMASVEFSRILKLFIIFISN